MIKRQNLKDDKVKVTFVQPRNGDDTTVSVVGDFNQWDPQSQKLVKRNNGTSSVSMTFDTGKKYAFRYYEDSGRWFNDEAADDYEVGEHGQENCILYT